MRNDDDRHLGRQLGHQILDLRDGGRVDGGAGLVHQQDIGLHRKHARDAQTLLLATGKILGALLKLVLDLIPQRGTAERFLDEPCSALDPISTLAIEQLMTSIADGRAIIIVTHNMEQATRVSNRTAFFYMGEMVETGETEQIFNAPRTEKLQDYLNGRFS